MAEKIKKSKIWNTARGILSIMSDLKEGMHFDSGDMNVLINAMIDFLNNTIKPVNDKVVEPIQEGSTCNDNT